MNKKKVGRPSVYNTEMKKKNLRLPMYIWRWLDNYAENRTKALISIYNTLSESECVE